MRPIRGSPRTSAPCAPMSMYYRELRSFMWRVRATWFVGAALLLKGLLAH